MCLLDSFLKGGGWLVCVIRIRKWRKCSSLGGASSWQFQPCSVPPARNHNEPRPLLACWYYSYTQPPAAFFFLLFLSIKVSTCDILNPLSFFFKFQTHFHNLGFKVPYFQTFASWKYQSSRVVNFFTQSNFFKPNFTPIKMHISSQI